MFRNFIAAALALGLCPVVAGLARAQAPSPAPLPRDLMSDTWVGTDGLGRTLPDASRCGPPKPDRTVGIFYFLWMQGDIRWDITRLLQQNPTNPAYGPHHAFHWWGEPQLGHYRSDDPFVIRKHMQMLTDAGVDVLIFDATNGFTYDPIWTAVCEVLRDIRRTTGRTTPRIAFFANSRAAKTVRHLHDALYARGLFRELWFEWDGKPLLLAPLAEVPADLAQFYTVRESWAWTKGHKWYADGRDRWPWLDHTPQQPGWHVAPDRPEQICVCVAEHPVSNIGRSHRDGRQPPPGEIRPELGLYYAEQWRRALEVGPPFVFLTGWNEWIAQRQLAERRMQFLGRPIAAGETYFVDAYNQEFSRDIEPMRGGHGDHYYYQTVIGIRLYKGVRPRPKATPPKTIRINSDFLSWQGVGPEYLDDLGDTAHRNHPAGDGGGALTNATGRNDFDRLQVARDAANLYFHARTRERLAPPGGTNGMMLLINADADARTGWEGCDFVINRLPPDAGGALLERHVGPGWTWAPVARVPMAALGNELHLAVPRAAVGAAAGRVRFDFKWADNVPASGDIRDFMDQGDTAPNGRFFYRYEE